MRGDFCDLDLLDDYGLVDKIAERTMRTIYKQPSIYNGKSIYNGNGIYDKLPTIPDMSIRFKFSDLNYSPVDAGVGASGTWNQVRSNPNIWDWTYSSGNWYRAFYNAFKDPQNLVTILGSGKCDSLVSIYSAFESNDSLEKIVYIDIHNVSQFRFAFASCSRLKSIPTLDYSNATNIDYIVYNCTNLEAMPVINSTKITTMEYAFAGCSKISKLIPIDTHLVTNVYRSFYGCVKVKTGALDLYEQMSTQTNPPTNTTDCFKNCGRDTPTGLAELQQIPSSWGGLAP